MSMTHLKFHPQSLQPTTASLRFSMEITHMIVLVVTVLFLIRNNPLASNVFSSESFLHNENRNKASFLYPENDLFSLLIV